MKTTVICKNEESLMNLHTELVKMDKTFHDFSVEEIPGIPRYNILQSSSKLVTYTAFNTAPYLFYLVIDDPNNDPLDFSMIATSDIDQVLEIIRKLALHYYENEKPKRDQFFGFSIDENVQWTK